MAQFTKTRFQTRLYAFCWTILETRQPNFDGEKVKNQNWILTILQSLEYASEEEKAVINKLPDIIKDKPDEEDQRSSIMGALEGKQVVYKRMNPNVLLEERDFLSTDTEQKRSSESTNSTGKYIALGVVVVLLGIVIYNLPITREWRAYRAITTAGSTYVERHAIKTYMQNFPKGKHLEDVSYRNVLLNTDDETCMTQYMQTFPEGAHIGEVRQAYDDCLYNRILQQGNQMTDIMYYIGKLPNGTYNKEVNRLCDSIWDYEIAKYHAHSQAKKSPKAVKYLDTMLEYMKTNRVNELVFSTESKYKLKDYTEYSQSIRDDMEYLDALERLPVHGNVVSIKDNFSSENKSSLDAIINRGLQASFDSIFTPGFIKVSDRVQKRAVPFPQARFNYEIKSQEYTSRGKSYPQLWTYSMNHVPIKYLIGIDIFFHVVFTIPNSNVTYEFSGKGQPEKDISGIQDISDGYRQMTIMSFARFSNTMYAKFGLKEVYFQ